MKKNKKIVETNNSVESNNEEKFDSNKEEKKYVALKTTSILCDKEYKLIEGEEIPKEIPEGFINSLVNSNLIK